MEQFFTDYLDLLQDLHKDFIKTFDGLPQEALDWIPGADMNSFCVLVVHTTGSSRFWIGDLGLGDPSARDRDAEFLAKGLTVDQLKERFAAVETYARAGLEKLTLVDLATIRPVPGRGRDASVTFGLLHALEHTGVHLGHAQITRQLWDARG